MFIEIVHANGIYSPETGKHTTPNKMYAGYYGRLAHVLGEAASKGAAILYHPNLISFTKDIWATPGEIDRALQSDPCLAIIGGVDGLIVRPDGNRPLDVSQVDLDIKDRLTKEHGGAIVAGAYTRLCVPAAAYNLTVRNPGYPIGIDPQLSIDNGASYVQPEHAAVPHFSIALL